MKAKHGIFTTALFLLLASVFLFSGCAMPANGAGEADADGSRATAGTALRSLTHQLTWKGTDVITPVVKWYFTTESTAPAGYTFKFRFSYHHRLWYDLTDPGSWTVVGTQTHHHFSTASVTVEYPSSWAAALVKGKVEVWRVRESTGAQTYIGSFTEPEEFVVMVNSD